MRKIREYGVSGDGYQDETLLIQRAIDECAKNKEILIFEADIYLTPSRNDVF